MPTETGKANGGIKRLSDAARFGAQLTLVLRSIWRGAGSSPSLAS